MPFNPDRFRIERFDADASTHSAYNFLSLKGVIAERWAHGPIFGSFREIGQQVTLTPAPGDDRRIQASYALKGSMFNQERIDDVDWTQDLSAKWHRDVYEVLAPKRTTRLNTGWFGLYPVRDGERASKRLRERFYKDDQVEVVRPQRFRSYHFAVDSIMLHGDTQYSLVVGAVGPPHHGQFFLHSDPDRDKAWWIGVRTSMARIDDNGIADPPTALAELARECHGYFDQAAHDILPTVAE